MKLPLQIAFRHMHHDAELEALVRDKAAGLDRFAPDIVSCRVVLELAGKHHLHGNQYDVHLDIKVPGGEIAVTREPGQHAEYRDVAVALRDAFDAAKRKLEDYERVERHAVKSHADLPHARVHVLHPLSDFGFLRTADGRDIYFHRHSVAGNAFDALDLGAEVTFVEAEKPGEKGPQASTVHVVGRHQSV